MAAVEVTESSANYDINDQDESLPTKGLLQLVGEPAGLKLLIFIKGEVGGIQKLLNLRGVCKPIKIWLDSLPPETGFDLFKHAQAVVNINSHNNFQLVKFLDYPPPPYVTSLSLINATGFEDASKQVHGFQPNIPELAKILFDDPNLSESQSIAVHDKMEKQVLWRDFVNLWSGDSRFLMSLEVDDLQIPLLPHLDELVESTLLRRFRCKTISCQEPHLEEFPKFLFHLNELDFHHLNMDVKNRQSFWSQLAQSSSLKRLTVRNQFDIDSFNELVASPLDRHQFVLKFRVFRSPSQNNQENSDDQSPTTPTAMGSPIPFETFRSFVDSVGKSTADVRLFDLHAHNLASAANPEFGLHEHDKTRFRSFVRSIDAYSPQPYVLELEAFPNLHRVTFDESPLSTDTIPDTVKEVIISGETTLYGFPAWSNLTSFRVERLHNYPYQLMRSLIILNKQCPLLRNLDICWNLLSDEVIGIPLDFESIKPQMFPNLRYFNFTLSCEPAHWTNQISAETRIILFYRLKLSQLSLRSLSFNRGGVHHDHSNHHTHTHNHEDASLNTFPLFNVESFINILEKQSQLRKTLCVVHIDPDFIEPSTKSMRDTLLAVAYENRHFRYGCRRDDLERD